MGFRVGDKVTLCNPRKVPEWEYKGVTGTITDIDIKIRIKWDTNECVLCGVDDCSMRISVWSYWPDEIKSIPRIGEQLLLFEL